MGKLNIPNTRKLHGFNLCPKKSDVDSGPGRAWESMFLNWDWDNWIKPQIDFCAGNNIGLNCCRVISGVMGVHVGLYSQDYLNGRMRQLIEYCAGLGVHFYVAGTGKSSYAQAPVTVDQLAESMGSMLHMAQAYPSVIAADLVQEANVVAIPNDAYLIGLISALKSQGVTLPLTCSTYESSLASAATAPWIYAMAQYFDFIDLHNYTYPITMQAYDALMAAFPDKEVLIGEYGRTISIPEASRVVDLRQSIDLANSGNPRIRGGLIWAATDQDTADTNMWGIYPTTFTTRSQDTQLLLRRYTGGSVAALNQKQF